MRGVTESGYIAFWEGELDGGGQQAAVSINDINSAEAQNRDVIIAATGYEWPLTHER